MAKKRLTTQDRLALDSWNELVASVREHSDINPTDTETEIRQRRERTGEERRGVVQILLRHDCTCESAAFHRKAYRAADEEQTLVRGKGLVTRAGEIRTLH